MNTVKRAPCRGRIPESLKAGAELRRTAMNARRKIRSPPGGFTADAVPIFDQHVLGSCPIGRLPERAARHSRGNVP